MHDTAYRIGGYVFETYLPPRKTRILEIGAQNVNGSLRDHAPRTSEYIGLDFEAGDGVDLVIDDCDTWPVDDASFDLIAASSVFEHDSTFWRTFLAMCRKTRPGGYIYISAPSNGMIHRYPQDCWRFYPDAGRALEGWGHHNDLDVTLIESFTAEREGDMWNDFCAVFRVGPDDSELPTSFVHEKLPTTNVLTWRSASFIKVRDASEDMVLLDRLRTESSALRAHAEWLANGFADQQANWEQERSQLSASEGSAREMLGDLQRQLTQQRTEADALRRAEAEVAEQLRIVGEANDVLGEDLAGLDAARAEVARLQSHLAQRSEEAEQAWARVRAGEERVRAVEARLEKLTGDLNDANDWVGKLAMTRAQLEQRIAGMGRREKAQLRENGELIRKVDRLQAALEELSHHEGSAEESASSPADADGGPRDQELLELRERDRQREQHLARAQAEAADAAFELRTVSDRTARMTDELAALGRLVVEAEDRAGVLARQLRDAEDAAARAADLAEGDRAKAEDKITQQDKQLRDAQGAATRLGIELDESRSVIANHRRELEDHRNETETRVQKMTQEIVLLTQMLRDVETTAYRSQAVSRAAALESSKETTWLRAIARFLLERQPSWWSALPEGQLNRRRNQALLHERLFDADDYAARYPDVVESGQTPLRHYIVHGMDEGRLRSDVVSR